MEGVVLYSIFAAVFDKAAKWCRLSHLAEVIGSRTTADLTTGFDIAGMINSNIFGEETVANYSDSLPGSEKALKPFS